MDAALIPKDCWHSTCEKSRVVRGVIRKYTATEHYFIVPVCASHAVMVHQARNKREVHCHFESHGHSRLAEMVQVSSNRDVTRVQDSLSFLLG